MYIIHTFSSHVCGSVCTYVHICMVVKEFIYTSYICIYVYIISLYKFHLIYEDMYACMYTYIYMVVKELLFPNNFKCIIYLVAHKIL